VLDRVWAVERLEPLLPIEQERAVALLAMSWTSGLVVLVAVMPVVFVVVAVVAKWKVRPAPETAHNISTILMISNPNN